MRKPAEEQIRDLQYIVDKIYIERNALVCALSKLFPSHLCSHDKSDPDWKKDWLTIVCIHLPTGQATWHIHDDELDDFAHLQFEPNHWDGHKTNEKYARLKLLEPKIL